MTNGKPVLPYALGALGAAVAAISLFLPFVDEASSGFIQVAENTMLQSDYGWLNVLFLATWVVGLALNYRSPHRVSWPFVVGGLTIGSAVWAAVDEDQRTLCPIGASSISDDCTVAEPGVGIYALGIGGGLMVLSGFFFRQRPEETTVGPSALDPMTMTRECPYCKSAIRPDASVCPHCRRESTPWTFHEDRWWRKDENGVWSWYEPYQPNVGWQVYGEAGPTARG